MSELHPNPFQVTRPHERALVRVLVMSLRRRLNVSMMVGRLAEEYSGRSRRALRQVAWLMSEGTPLVSALEHTPRALDPTAVLALRLATETGTFPERLESLISDDVAPDALRASGKNASEGQLMHVIVGFMVAWIIITFMLLFIIPTFEKMFDEFGVGLPKPMLWLIAMGNFSGLWLVVLPVVLFLIMIGPIFYGGPTWPLGIGVRMPRAGSDLLALLAMNLQSGRTLASGVASLARYHPITSLRVRLFHVSAAIDRGENGWDAMANQKLIRPQQATALKMTDDPLAQSWLLHREAQTGRRWKDERADFIASAFSLLSLFLLAAIVILVAVGVFMALYELVNGMSYPENLR